MVVNFRVAACVSLGFSLSATLFAQEYDIPVVRGVEGILWGSARREVVQSRGFPKAWSSRDSVSELTYPTEINGMDATVTFEFVVGSGLVSGRYQTEPSRFSSCPEHFELLWEFIAHLYPTLSPSVTQIDPGSIDPCEGAESGGAAPVSWKSPGAVIGAENRSAIWHDPRSNALIVLRLGEFGLELLLLGPERNGNW